MADPPNARLTSEAGGAEGTPPHDPDADRAVLVFGEDSAWRLRWRDALRRIPVAVLLASRSAEAAKWLADPRLILIVAVDDAAARRTVGALAPSLPVVWMAATGDRRNAPTDAELDAVLRLLSASPVD